MILFNKLARIDLLLLIGLILFFILKSDFWHGVISGFTAGCLLISIVNHIRHYKQTKKLY
jgi:hypothetical protein